MWTTAHRAKILHGPSEKVYVQVLVNFKFFMKPELVQYGCIFSRLFLEPDLLEHSYMPFQLLLDDVMLVMDFKPRPLFSLSIKLINVHLSF